MSWERPFGGDPAPYAASVLLSVSQKAPGLSAAKFLQQAQGQPRFYWNDADPITFAGAGTAVELFAWGEKRIQQIEAQARALFDGALVSDENEPLAVPRLFGGFAFRDDFTPDNTWATFHPAHFVLPHYQLLQREDEAWLTINALVGQDENPATLLPELRSALRQRSAQLAAAPEPDLADGPQPGMTLTYPMSFEQWADGIQAATSQMRDGKLEKVVLSRVCEIRLPQPVDIDRMLTYLDRRYAGCYRFLFEPRSQHAFYGATPELLVKINGRSLETMALAGSAARGKTETQDAQLAQELLDSPKNRFEHQLVVDALQHKLSAQTASLTFPKSPQIYKLSNIQHLYTPFTATLPDESGVLPWVEQLHPTPALGGTPPEAAMAFIEQAELVPRGWYAAPIGWIDHKLDGVFGVAIRSAVAQKQRVWAYAGAGIVADSQPQAEWEETALKFRPMLWALGGKG